MDKNFEKELDIYLKKLESYIEHLPISSRNMIIREIEQELLNIIKNNNYSLHQALKQFGDKESHLNRHLLQHGLGRAKLKSSWNKFQIIILSLVLLIVAGTLSIVILIKSLMPIFDFDPQKGTFTLLGQKIDINYESAQLSAFDQKLKKDPRFLYDINANFSKNEFLNLQIDMESGVIGVIPSEKTDDFKLTCTSTEQNSNYVQKSVNQIDIKLTGESRCKFFIPENKDFKINLTKGEIFLNNMTQNFSINLNEGNLIWNQQNKSIYKIESNRSVYSNDFNHTQTEIFNAKIHVENGELRIF